MQNKPAKPLWAHPLQFVALCVVFLSSGILIVHSLVSLAMGVVTVNTVTTSVATLLVAGVLAWAWRRRR